MLYDKLGRTWNNRKIMWIRKISASGRGKYTMEKRDDVNKLTYDIKNGFYDKNGKNIRESYLEIVPVLEKLDNNQKPILNEWENFPNTKESYEYKKYINFEGYKEMDFSENIIE